MIPNVKATSLYKFGNCLKFVLSASVGGISSGYFIGSSSCVYSIKFEQLEIVSNIEAAVTKHFFLNFLIRYLLVSYFWVFLLDHSFLAFFKRNLEGKIH